MQGLHRPVRSLLGDRIVKPWRGILGVKSFGNCILAIIQRRSFFFIVSFAQIAADKSVVGVQAGGSLEVPATLVQIALPDLGQTQTQSWEGVSLIQGNRFGKGISGLFR